MKGRKLGNYRIAAFLGRGATAMVYRAKDDVTQRQVAIKLLTASFFSQEDHSKAVASLLREVKAASVLHHSNIVALYDYHLVPADTVIASDDVLGYIVLELVPGRSLARHFKLKDRVGQDFALQLMAGVLAGLEHAHSCGVIHGDIKPGNILMGITGNVKIADFGVSRHESSHANDDGTPLATVSYVAPELLFGRVAERRSDIFAAGAVLYECLTGERAFPGYYAATIARSILSDQPIAPSLRNPDVPKAFDAVVARALAKEPEQRFASATEFAESIRSAVGHQRWNVAVLAANGASGIVNPLWNTVRLEPEPTPEETADEAAEPSTAPLQLMLERAIIAPETPHAPPPEAPHAPPPEAP
ncbi:MAG: serine/threonine-protein kinase, partial [Rhodospirillaceae bacterium]